jgi:endo-1,4-beta-xylanase
MLGTICTQALSAEGFAFASSIPESGLRPCAQSGKIENLSYDCYHYTDSTDMGVNVQPIYDKQGYELPQRDAALAKKCNVYVPFNYDKNHTYPVIYLLHGITENESAYMQSRYLPVMFDQLIASGAVEPFIAVFPNGNSGSHFLDRSFSNQAGYYFFGNELTKDLIPFIESRYNVRKDRDGRAICGFSMGGMQALNIGLCQSLDWFSWFGAFAAAPTSYPSDKIASLLKEKGVGKVNYLYCIVGRQDNVAGQSHATALESLRDKAGLDASRFHYQIEDGGHDWNIAFLGVYNFVRVCFR